MLSCNDYVSKSQNDIIAKANSSQLMSDQTFGYESFLNHENTESINGENLQFVLSEQIKDIESLKQQVKQYRASLEQAKRKFDEGKHVLNIPFAKIALNLVIPWEKDLFYASLGYDVDIINMMAYISDKVLDPKVHKPEGVVILNDIFEGVYHIMLMYHLILYLYLSDENLEYSHQSEDNIEKTSEYITKIGKNMDDMLDMIQIQIRSALVAPDYNAMCDALKYLVNSDGIITSTFKTTRTYETLIRQWFYNT